MEKLSYEDYCKNSYREVHLPDELGYWVVMSADTNPDYNGCHCVHPLMVVKGTFKQAVERACQIPGYDFHCYGYGEVKRIEFTDLAIF